MQDSWGRAGKEEEEEEEEGWEEGKEEEKKEENQRGRGDHLKDPNF